ncbi:MAG TPA: DUF1552 domain-containing protein [Polyangiaceae bacterium]|nr:DUF1552 domain-containing protein [Polyangiaceae bacterium]
MISRRNFVLAGSAALIPGLVAGAARRAARAQSATAPVRFLAVRTPHGVDRDYWIPRNMDGTAPLTQDEALSGLTFEYDNSIMNAMMPWRDKITIIDGLDSQCIKENTRPNLYANHGHNEQGTMLTGAQAPADRSGNFDNHPSLDFVLHGLLGAPVLPTASVSGAGTWKCMSFDSAGIGRDPETSPAALFQQCFPADFMPPAAGTPMIDYADGENRIINAGQAQLAALEARLASVEKDKITAHRDAMAALLKMPGGAMAVGQCTTKGTDVPANTGDLADYTLVQPVARAHAAVIAQAFACGRASCATLRILDDYPNFYTDVPEVQASGAAAMYGAMYRYHENLVHDYWGATGATLDTLRVGYTAGLRWAATHFAAVLEEFANVPDPMDPNGGTMLDNTIIYWHSEFGHFGHDNQHMRHPIVIAGGGGKTLKLGRYLRLRDIESDTVRVPHNKLLVSLAHAMGRTEINYFGDRDLVDRPEYQGPLVELMA